MNDIWINEGSKVDLWGKIDRLNHHAHKQLRLLEKLNSIHPRQLPPITKLQVIKSLLTLTTGTICDCGKVREQ